MTQIRYSEHAIERLNERESIKRGMIEDALLDPLEVVEGRGESRIVHKMTGDKLLRVVFKEGTDHILIVTAYLARPERYLGRKPP